MGALGGGFWLTQNKVLPGSYINFISAARPSNLFSERGYAAIGLSLDWGAEDEIIEIGNAELQKDTLKLFGVEYTHESMKPLREMLKGSQTVYLYRLNGGGVKATVTVAPLTATAKYSGTIGNKLKVVVESSIDVPGSFDVITMLDGKKIEAQTVAKVEDLKANDYIVFSGTGTPVASAGASLTGGTNGVVSGESHSTFLEKIETYRFNAIGYAGTDDLIKALYIAFADRLRDEEGIKTQAVVYRKNTANHEGVISVENEVLDEGATGAELVYWVTGQEAGVAVNRSLTNAIYDGEYVVDVAYKKSDYEKGIQQGKFLFYSDRDMVKGDKVRVLQDINTFTEFSLYKNQDFSYNQVIRVLDQIAIDIANIYNERYLGKVQNNQDGRVGFWGEIITHHKTLQQLGAIEDFDGDKDVTVVKGEAKNAVVVMDYIMPVMAMEKLYMTVVVR